MEYKKKTDEEILALVEEFQKESLFRAYCNPFWSERGNLGIVEIWAEAKELLPKLAKKNEDTSSVIAIYQNIYQRRYISLFKHLPSVEEQLRKSKDVCDSVFATLCIMCYHCMQTNEKLKEYLTFDKIVNQEGHNTTNEGQVHIESFIVKDLLTCLEYYTYFLHLEIISLYRETYDDKKKEFCIVFDYDYTGLLAKPESEATEEGEACENKTEQQVEEQVEEQTEEVKAEELAEEAEPQTGKYVYDKLKMFLPVTSEAHKRLKEAVNLCQKNPTDYAYLMKACYDKGYIRETGKPKGFLDDLIKMELLADGTIKPENLSKQYVRKKEEAYDNNLYKNLFTILKKPHGE